MYILLLSVACTEWMDGDLSLPRERIRITDYIQQKVLGIMSNEKETCGNLRKGRDLGI